MVIFFFLVFAGNYDSALADMRFPPGFPFILVRRIVPRARLVVFICLFMRCGLMLSMLRDCRSTARSFPRGIFSPFPRIGLVFSFFLSSFFLPLLQKLLLKLVRWMLPWPPRRFSFFSLFSLSFCLGPSNPVMPCTFSFHRRLCGDGPDAHVRYDSFWNKPFSRCGCLEFFLVPSPESLAILLRSR